MGALQLFDAEYRKSTHMLVNQEHGDVFPLLSEALEGPFDL